MIRTVVCDLGYVLDELWIEVENLTVFGHVKLQLWYCQTWWTGECLCLIFVPSSYLITITIEFLFFCVGLLEWLDPINYCSGLQCFLHCHLVVGLVHACVLLRYLFL